VKKIKCDATLLARGPDAAIHVCGCGRYHVEMESTTLHLTPSQFDSLARLFKLALGSLCARKGCRELAEADHPDTQFAAKTKAETNRIICLQCGESFELVFDQTECLKNDMAHAYGFEMVQHNMQIFGYCQWCRTRPT
jgi:Ferric uptake regulator family